MNKKITTLSDKFISSIHSKSHGENKDIIVRLELREKEMQLENRQEMLGSLKRQAELERVSYNLLKLQNELAQCRDGNELDEKLMAMARKYEM